MLGPCIYIICFLRGQSFNGFTLRRTALERGAAEVVVVARRHGTICPKAKLQNWRNRGRSTSNNVRY